MVVVLADSLGQVVSRLVEVDCRRFSPVVDTGEGKHACMFRKTVAISETTFSLGTVPEPDDRSDEVGALHDNADTLRLDDCPIF